MALAGLVACGGAGGMEPRELAAVRILAAWAPGSVQQTYVLRSASAWQSAWQQHEPATEPRATRPEPDFSRQMVLGITAGSGPTGCHGLSIRKVTEMADQVTVDYALATPAPGAICTQVVVALTDFVVVERLDKPVVFRLAGSS